MLWLKLHRKRAAEGNNAALMDQTTMILQNHSGNGRSVKYSTVTEQFEFIVLFSTDRKTQETSFVCECLIQLHKVKCEI